MYEVSLRGWLESTYWGCRLEREGDGFRVFDGHSGRYMFTSHSLDEAVEYYNRTNREWVRNNTNLLNSRESIEIDMEEVG